MDLVPSDVEAYAAAHTTPFEAWMDELHARAAAELPYAEMLSGPVVGRLLQTLVAAVQARLVVEVGTYAGYAALAMAAALPPGGRVVTLELDERHADFAQRAFDASPYADRIELRRGPALASLQQLAGPYDLVFVDADKTGYPDYYEAALARLSPHGLIVADNTLHDGGVLDPASDADRVIDELNTRWATDDRVIATQLTVRDGVTLIRRAP
ncbi:MAG TPA: class I SAM-dependent methyltransferase [Baekduia sp.]|uniref:O-methyltransferase n=1 Tax=Baekduia sp. TaxID=2600305 RepID=UPI002CBB3028|nr:class I SAM-dependent methyltransferase [Baekduia sp.]HMJ37160.1 class I SAM-dependent methyltransferase [Baekduia sp.]